MFNLCWICHNRVLRVRTFLMTTPSSYLPPLPKKTREYTSAKTTVHNTSRLESMCRGSFGKYKHTHVRTKWSEGEGEGVRETVEVKRETEMTSPTYRSSERKQPGPAILELVAAPPSGERVWSERASGGRTRLHEAAFSHLAPTLSFPLTKA